MYLLLCLGEEVCHIPATEETDLGLHVGDGPESRDKLREGSDM